MDNIKLRKIQFNPNDWASNQGVLIPKYLLKPVQPRKPADSGFALYVPYSELFGYKLSEKEIYDIVSKFRMSDCVTSASKLGVTIENSGHFNKRIQVGLVVHLYPKTLATQINTILLGQDDRFIFFEQQLLNVIKIGLLYGSHKPVKNFRHSEIFDEYMTKVVLGIADHLEGDFESKEKGVLGDRHKLAELLISIAIRNLSFNSSEQFRYLIGRYYQLFFTIPARKKLRNSVNFIDINKALKRATSFDIWTYYALGFSILTQYALADVNRGKLKPEKFFINRYKYFANIKINKRRAVRFLNKLSFTPKLYKEEFPIELTKTKNFFYSFLLFRKKPLVRLSGFLYFVTNLRFLKEKITAGIFWEIADSLSGEEKNKFFRFVGEIYEEYIKDIIKRIYKTQRGFAKRYSFEIKYKDSKQEKKTSDVIISYGNKVILVEAKAARLKMDTCVLGDLKSFRDDLEKMVYSASKQLERVITDWRSDKFRVPGINIDNSTVFYPVIVTLNPIPQVDLIWQEEINKELKSRGYFLDHRIKPLQVIDTEELEMLEPLIKSGAGMVDILDKKINDPNFIYKPMKNFLLRNVLKDGVDYSNIHLHRQFGKISRVFRKMLFNK